MGNPWPPVTREELEILYVRQLMNFAQVYGLELSSKMLKSDIIDAILEVANKPFRYDDEPKQMSVRIKRIHENNKEN